VDDLEDACSDVRAAIVDARRARREIEAAEEAMVAAGGCREEAARRRWC
jgi:hypothetical protein